MFESQTSSIVNLPPALRAMVENELSDGERAYWAGQPRPGRLAMKALPVLLGAIPMIVFGVVWIWGTSNFGPTGEDAPGVFRFFPFFGAVPVLLGLAALSAPYWMMRKARRTVYVVTDRRAVIFNPSLLGFGSLSIHSYSPDRLRSMERKQRADGSGDLIFERRRTNVQINNRPQTKAIGFLAIENVKNVEKILQTLIETSTNTQEH